MTFVLQSSKLWCYDNQLIFAANSKNWYIPSSVFLEFHNKSEYHNANGQVNTGTKPSTVNRNLVSYSPATSKVTALGCVSLWWIDKNAKQNQYRYFHQHSLQRSTGHRQNHAIVWTKLNSSFSCSRHITVYCWAAWTTRRAWPCIFWLLLGLFLYS